MNKNRNNLLLSLFIFSFLILATGPVRADVETEMPLAYEDHGFHDWRDKVSTGTDHVDPFSGSLQRSYLDLVLPGNGGMDINIQRSYSSNIWYSRGPKTYSTPPFPSYLFPRSPAGVGWTIHLGRILKADDPADDNDTVCDKTIDNTLNNTVLELPDGSSHVFVVDDVGRRNADFVTTSNWFAKCNVGGSGLIVYSPDGLIYTMNHFVNPFVSDGYTTKLQRAWYPSKIEDRNGNYINITYHANPLNTHALIDRITAYNAGELVDDSRKVVFDYYPDSTIKSISSYDNATLLQTVIYEYVSVGAVGHKQLSKVIMPDGRQWSYNYCPSSTTENCAPDALQTVTSPYGASTTYNYGWEDFNGTLLGESAGTTNYYSWVVTKRIQAGLNIPEAIWTYDYWPGEETAIEPGFNNDYTIVKFPGGKYIYKHYGIQRQLSITGISYGREIWKTGRLIEKEIYEADGQGGYQLIQTESFDWIGRHVISLEKNVAVGYFNTERQDSINYYDFWIYNSYLSRKTISRDGTIFSTTYDHTNEDPNLGDYTRTRNIIEESKVGTTILGQRSYELRWFPIDLSVRNFVLFNQKYYEFYPDLATYNSNEALYRSKSILRWFNLTNGDLDASEERGIYESYTYHLTGDLNTREDANNNTWTYQDYYRGIPRDELHPEGILESRIVNPTGTVREDVNGREKTTIYDYDSMNRLSMVDLPKPLNESANIDIIWSATDNTRTVLRDKYEQNTRLDGLKRPICIQTMDSANGVSIIKLIRYDALGRKIFESYPYESGSCPAWSADIPAGIDGTLYEYDILGRITSVIHPDGKSQSIRYLAGNKKEVTDEDGHITTYTYRSFGDPDNKKDTVLVRTDSPENVTTEIDRDVLGLPNWVEQKNTSTGSGFTRTYTYKPYTSFVSSIEDPETGVTSIGRDAVGNMISKSIVDSGEITYYCYDELNRLKIIDYQDANTPDILYNHDGNDNITDISSRINGIVNCSSSPSLTGGSILSDLNYIYDDNDNLTDEIINVILDGVTHQTTYIYDNLDHVSTVQYPSFATTSHQVEYAPDAFGRPTQAMPYVNDVGHYPGGQLKYLVYANGIQTDFGLDRRQRTNDITTRGGVSSLFYEYDGRSNPTSIRDRRDSTYNRTMDYDGLNRLTAAGGYWGSKSIDSIKYDEVGNLRSKKLGTSMDLSYTYAVNNRLDTITGTSNYSFIYDGHGNVTGNGKNQFVYDKANNLVEVKSAAGAPIWDDLYDGNNRRVRRLTSAGEPTYYLYTKSNLLLGEYDGASRIKEYVYLGDKLVAAYKFDNNVLPIAVASVDQTSANEGATVTLDGSLSSGTIVGYSWDQQGQYAATIQSPDSVTTSVVLPRVRTNTVLTFTLTVVDDGGSIATTSVNVTVINTSNDDDQDGMDDNWEETNFPNTPIEDVLPSTDTDGDGATNLQEYNQQSDPNDPVPFAPQNVKVNLKIPDLEITWNPIIEATSYNIYWSNTPGVTKANGTKIANVTSPYVHTGLDSSKTYHYVITAENAFGESVESAEVQARPDISWLIPILNLILE